MFYAMKDPIKFGDFVEMNEIIKYDLSMTDEEHFLQTHS